jgi:hypothetical protein
MPLHRGGIWTFVRHPELDDTVLLSAREATGEVQARRDADAAREALAAAEARLRASEEMAEGAIAW